ncbi:hypothetical protein PF003_g25254 [Phytophthora fragariae]|nr:hypothetical protein PF003_g25254 [Phytophthora fragariae]
MSPQGAEISVGGDAVLNFCANNYLGLSHNQAVEQAVADTLKERGFGLSSGHDRVPVVLRRQRRTLRGRAQQGRRHPYGRAQPRQHHRRHQALQGGASPLQAHEHDGPGAEAQGHAALLNAAHRHGRRLHYGRRFGSAAGDRDPAECGVAGCAVCVTNGCQLHHDVDADESRRFVHVRIAGELSRVREMVMPAMSASIGHHWTTLQQHEHGCGDNVELTAPP